MNKDQTETQNRPEPENTSSEMFVTERSSTKINLEEVEAKLRNKTGPAYWRGLEEIASTPEFEAWIGDEFPNRKDLTGLDRRTFLKFMGASIAMAGLSGCRSVFMPVDKIVPYVVQPEGMLLGKPLFYATTLPLMGYGFGVLCSQREGRPIKLEGNPSHPISRGSIDSMTSAQILNFYDPDRLANVMSNSEISTWEQFQQDCEAAVTAQKVKKGAGLRILSEYATSPTEASQIQSLLKQYPLAKWHVYDPMDSEGARLGSQQAFGKFMDVHYDLSKAKVIVSLDSDFLLRRPDSVLLARQWADGRRIEGVSGEMNRLYVIESSLSITGGAADHRWPVKPSEIHGVTAAIAAGLGIGSTSGSAIPANVMSAIVKDLQANSGHAVVIPGEGQPAAVHALCSAINEKLGAFGNTVAVSPPADYLPGSRIQSLKDLTDDLNQGKVDAIFILGGNPVYTAPSDFDFGTALGKAKFKVYHSLYETETSTHVDWTAPLSHPLESWGDYNAFDGTVSLCQPLMTPLHDAWTHSELISSLTGPKREGYDLLREHYAQPGHGMKDDDFKKALYAGVIAKKGQVAVTPTVNIAAASAAPVPASATGAGIELKFKSCGKVYDGSFTNNGWLRELPDQITKITWDNIAEVGPAMAKRMGIDTGSILQIQTKSGQILAPAFIQPGQPDGAITLTLGYGRDSGGVVALADDCIGYNAYALRVSSGMGFTTPDNLAQVQNQGGDYRLANVQTHHGMEGRDIVRVGTLLELQDAVKNHKKPFLFADEDEVDTGLPDDLTKSPTLYPSQIFDYKGEQWGMTIDLTTCTGCNACVTACQAENNIPVVGKDQVARGREMHWIRLDRYYGDNDTSSDVADTLANPSVVYQPIMCLMCEKATCEPVCPVAATVHSHDGLNQMVYNRCVGTRYCSDNCPYKVRRFNFLNYSATQLQFRDQQKIPLLKLLNNPEVTVRSRGVMEKCTYCVERISDARIESKKSGIPMKDGSIVTACQQACPTKTITFGNIMDENSEVTKWRKDPRAYLLLEDLNTKPRTSHMARLKNPNPEVTA